MEDSISQFVQFNDMVNDPTVSGIALKEMRVEVNNILNNLDQSQLRELFINLAISEKLGQLFHFITDHLSLESAILLTLELRLINPELHVKYRKGLKHVISRKERENEWMKVSYLEL